MEGPKVVASAYDFLKWVIPHISRFPKNQRYSIGSTIENKLLYLQNLLIEAQYSKEKAGLLRRSNIEAEQLRYLFRLCYDLQLINLKTYELSSRYLIEIGIQSSHLQGDAKCAKLSPVKIARSWLVSPPIAEFES